MRDTYESAKDRRAERLIIEEFLGLAEPARFAGHSYQKLPASYRVDYALIGNHGVTAAFVETKRRAYSVRDFDTAFLSLSKCMALRDLSEYTDCPSYMVWRFDDALLYTEMDGEPGARDLLWGGRADRLDSADYEPLVHFRIADLERIDLERP